jgi:DNA-binding SARP family transcriptional activator
MEYRLLGPVEVWNADELIDLGGTKPRTLLAALVLARGRVVPASRLVDVIWGDDPPRTAAGLVQSYVSALRKALPGDGVIVTRTPGYLLRASPEQIDLVVFEQAVAAGRQAVADGRLVDAAREFRAALALWRGPALAGVTGSVLAGEATRLEETRLAVLEERAAADLRRGAHRELVSELTALVREYPMRDVLRRHLMVALYLADRSADALAVFQEGRRILRDELGLEPGPALAAAHEAILRRDEDALGLTTPVTAPSQPPQPERTPSGPTPAQLPPLPGDFTGRVAKVAELVGLLSPAEPVTGVLACVVTGMGGAGKSTVALRVAHELVTAYPDGQLYAPLHGMTSTPAAVETVLSRFLTALGVVPAELPRTLHEREELYRSLLAGRRVLVVLDDAASEQQVRPLLPGSASCAVLVTTRNRLAGLAGVHWAELDMLTRAEATELLARIIGPDRVAAEPAAAELLIEQTGRMPLALRVAGARLATRRHWTVEQFAARLADERRRLDELVAGDQEVRASIALSYHALDEPDRITLRRLGLLGLADFPSWVVAALLDVPEQRGENVIERLLDAQLIEFARTDQAGQTRYRLHDLIRIYAHDRALAEEKSDTGRAAVGRVISGWLRLVNKINTALPTGGTKLRPPEDPAGETGPRPTDASRRAAANPHGWLEAEQHALIASVERAAALDLADAAADLASALCGSLFATDNMFDAWTRTLFDAWIRTHDAALAAVRRAGNRAAEARLLAEIGQLRYEQDRYTEARTAYMQALTVFRDQGDARGEAATLAALGAASREQGYLPEAVHFLNQAADVFRRIDDLTAIAYTDRLLGSVHLELGDLPNARASLTAALSQYRQAGSRRGEGMTLRTIGLVHRAAGDYQLAYDICRQAQSIFAELGDQLLHAYATRAVAKAQIRLGDPDAALPDLRQALDTCHDHGDRWGQAQTLRTLGEAHLAQRRWTEAERYLSESLRLWQILDLPLPRARTLMDLSRLRLATGDQDTADTLRAEAIDIFRLYAAREYTELTGS